VLVADGSYRDWNSFDIGLATVGWAFVGSGLYAMRRRPANRLGRVMVAAGVSYLLAQAFRQSTSAVAFTAGAWAGDFWIAVFAWLLLAFPTGRISTAFDWLVVALYAFVLGPLEFVWFLFWDPHSGPGNALVVWPNARIAADIDSIQRFAMALAAVAMAIALLRRWLAAGEALRRALIPVLFGAGSLVLQAILISLDKFQVTVPNLRWYLLAGYCAVPVAVVAGFARARWARGAVAELLVTLQSNPHGDLRAPLAQALGDPSLEVSYWLAKSGSYADAEGRAIDAPAGPGGRATTFIERDGARIAALTHDASLTDDAELLNAVTAAAGMALENGQLQAELKGRLDELEDSRARVIEAGHTERKRLERNLHDGTQQRLVALSMELAILQRRLGEDGEARARVEHARGEITASLAELRDVARGLYPAVLSLNGLPSALKSVTAGAGIPVALTVDVPSRLSEAVEVTAYYVVCECLANVGKHARASAATVTVVRSGAALVVEICDDGNGGADVQGGSGLRGLADRVEALGGALLVRSDSAGTRIRADIPCVPMS
jgi:signal transduction histidine kinase